MSRLGGALKATGARLVAGVLVAALVVAGIVYLVDSGPASNTVTAEFVTAPGLYVGNQVRILGMEVGKVTSIKPGPNYVTVVMQVPASVPLPANVQAFIMAPEVVNDRYVQLNPAYTSGPKLANHAVIPTARTATAISVDEIIDSLDSLSKALGPNGANAHGALSKLFAAAAKTLGPSAGSIHSTLTSLGSALAALSARSPQLTALFDNLGSLSKTASRYNTTYADFAADLATASNDLSSDDANLGAALGNLQVALGELAQFMRTNSSSLGQSVANFEVFAAAVASKQQQLASALGDLPTALDNLTQTVNPNAPGGPSLVSRFDPQGGSGAYSKALCGDPLLRLVLLSVDKSQDKDQSIDLDCAETGLLAELPLPPGATSGPDLSVDALLGGKP